MAKVLISAASASELPVDAVVVPVSKREGQVHVLPCTGGLPEHIVGDQPLGVLAASLGSNAAEGEITKLPSLGQLNAGVVATVGVGRPEQVGDADTTAQVWARVFGSAIRCLAGTAKVALLLPTEQAAGVAPEQLIRAVAEGALLAAYSFDAFRSGGDNDPDQADQPRHDPVREITLVVEDAGKTSHYQAIADRAAVIAQAVHLTRDLVNTPPSHLHPQELAEAAEQVGRTADVTVEVLDEFALRDGGYGGILGVGKGSVHPPRLVTMRYQPSGQTLAHLVLVGKGITFDSGGLSLKPPTAMETMKLDMAGAAAVIAAVGAIASLKIPVQVTGLAALAENLPSGTSQRPSDVLTTRNGTTVEVLNTDAEGRLVLADALADACTLRPDLIVDVATLTGAQMIALGNRTSAIMANSDQVREAVVAAAQAAGESMWPMPLPPQLRKSLDSAVADISNMGDRYGGMLVAGIFLQEFITEGQPWAHLDIAGPAFNTSAAWGYTPKQATGVAVRTLVELAQQLSEGKLTLPSRPQQESGEEG